MDFSDIKDIKEMQEEYKISCKNLQFLENDINALNEIKKEQLRVFNVKKDNMITSYKLLQGYEDSIKRILENIEYGRYSEKELLLEYVNLKALHSMKIHAEKKVKETKKALYDDFQRSIGYKEED